MTTRDPQAGTQLAGWREAAERALDASLPAETAWPESVHRAMRYSVFAGGKRLRPLLALAAAEAVGGAWTEALPFACAVELVHTYSLVHDDLPCMDDDDLRRGKPTAHKVFGEALAVLAGDALLTRAFALLADAPEGASHEVVARRLRALAALGQAAGTAGLIGGQVNDIEAEGREASADELERIHRAKTGALLEVCVRGGAILAGAEAGALAPLLRYARAMGLAFQVVDDVLDATEPAEQLGKTAGKDAAAQKATYVSVHGLERSRAMVVELRDEALAALAQIGPTANALRELAFRLTDRRT